MTTTYEPSARRPIADAFRRTADGTVRACVRLGVHPDAVSYGSIVASAGAAACFWFAATHPRLLLLAPLLCYLRLWLNMLDGMVAVAGKTASRRGEILNELPDRASDVLIFAGVAHSGLAHLPAGYWAAIAAVLTAYVGIFGQAIGTRREFGGVMSKPWRMVVLHVGAWTTFVAMQFGNGNRHTIHGPGLTILDYACLVVITGCVQTVAARLASTLKLLKQMPAAVPRSPATASEIDPAIVAAESIATPLASSEHTFASHDGAQLFYRHWPAATETTKALLLFHRGHEHSARWAETVRRLQAQHNVHIFAWDQRGHGRSPGERGYAEHVAILTRDADAWARHLVAAHSIRIEQSVVIAHSVGGVVAAAWVHDFAPPILGLVLATPALRVKLYVPFAVPLLRLKEKLLGRSEVKSYVKAHMLTRDPAEAAAYRADRAIFRQIAVNLLLDLHDTGTRLLRDAGAITCPTLLVGAGRDWVVKLSSQWEFFRRLGSPVKQMDVFPDAGHAMFHECERADVVACISRFAADCFDRGHRTPSLLDADRGGHTRTEYDRLRAPGGPQWAIIRGGLRALSHVSEGIRIGHAEGFDSGVMLDHVYANRAAGVPPFGKLVDRIYLDAIGWRGIRVRGKHLKSMLRAAIMQQQASGRDVHIVDVAAGAGRYVLETLRDLPHDVGATALLRDYKPANLAAASAMAARLGLSDRVRVEHGDAFDRASFAALQPRPTIGIVSGLLELFPDNGAPRACLAGLADAIAPGGALLYTCQPWHPQVEFIARALPNREGKPWIMRRRTQQEMDELVAAAGFEKLEQTIDRWGIFTVSAARRV